MCDDGLPLWMAAPPSGGVTAWGHGHEVDSMNMCLQPASHRFGHATHSITRQTSAHHVMQQRRSDESEDRQLQALEAGQSIPRSSIQRMQDISKRI